MGYFGNGPPIQPEISFLGELSTIRFSIKVEFLEMVPQKPFHVDVEVLQVGRAQSTIQAKDYTGGWESGAGYIVWPSFVSEVLKRMEQTRSASHRQRERCRTGRMIVLVGLTRSSST